MTDEREIFNAIFPILDDITELEKWIEEIPTADLRIGVAKRRSHIDDDVLFFLSPDAVFKIKEIITKDLENVLYGKTYQFRQLREKLK